MLSVVIPSYNHKEYLLQNVPRIVEHFDSMNIAHELLIVDDGSSDGTFEAMQELGHNCIRNPKNMGKGYSLRRGILASSGKYIFTTDTDLAVPIKEFSKLWNHRENDLVFGSRRKIGAGVSGITKKRLVLGEAYHLLLRSLLSLPIHDTQCGFKLFNSRIKGIVANCKLDGFVFDTELAYIAHKRDYSMKEVGVTWEGKPDSRVVLWKHPAQMLVEVMSILYNDLSGVYE
jgi:dolichyl-phosphate beta-glucosyltransferase